jgi:hypothetical protein
VFDFLFDIVHGQAKMVQSWCSAAAWGAQQDLPLCSNEGYSLQHSCQQHYAAQLRLLVGICCQSKLFVRSPEPIAWCSEQ